MSTGFRGPLRYNGAEFAARVGQPYSFLDDAPLSAIDAQQVLSVLNDEPRWFGYAFGGAIPYPGPYAAVAATQGGLALTATGAGVTAPAVLGGATRLSTGGADNNQTKVVSSTIFQLVAGRRIWFEVRFALAAVTTSAIMFGLVDAVPADISTAPADIDGIYFFKADGATQSSFRVQNDAVLAQVASVDVTSGGVVLADGVVREYGFLVDTTAGGAGAISAYVDGRLAGAIPSTSAARPDVLMQFALVVQTAAVATKDLDVFQALCIEEL